MPQTTPVGILFEGAQDTDDIARALRALANAFEKNGSSVIGKDWESRHVTMKVRYKS